MHSCESDCIYCAKRIHHEPDKYLLEQVFKYISDCQLTLSPIFRYINYVVDVMKLKALYVNVSSSCGLKQTEEQ